MILLARATGKVFLAHGVRISVCSCFSVLPLCSNLTFWNYSQCNVSEHTRRLTLLTAVTLLMWQSYFWTWMHCLRASESCQNDKVTLGLLLFICTCRSFPMFCMLCCPWPFAAQLTTIHSARLNSGTPSSEKSCPQFLPQHPLHIPS